MCRKMITYGIALFVVFGLTAVQAGAVTLTGWWGLDETSGTTAYNSVAGGPDGTYENGVTLGQPGIVGNAVEFDGVDDFVKVVQDAAGDTSLELGPQFSVAYWLFVKAESVDWMMPLAKGDPATPSNSVLTHQMQMNPGASGHVDQVVATLTAISTSINDTTWTHLVITHDGINGKAKLYLDGVPALLKPMQRSQGPVFQEILERRLLNRLKKLCAQCHFDNPDQYKLHSFRHHFASLCANHNVAHRKALAWLGHSSSEMLDLYYHLHDEDSRQAMMALAQMDESAGFGKNGNSSFEGNGPGKNRENAASS